LEIRFRRSYSVSPFILHYFEEAAALNHRDVKVKFSFTKTIWTSRPRQTQHYSPQVIKVAGQPAHRVTKHCIAFADEALHGLQLGTLYILAGGFVSKSFV